MERQGQPKGSPGDVGTADGVAALFEQFQQHPIISYILSTMPGRFLGRTLCGFPHCSRAQGDVGQMSQACFTLTRDLTPLLLERRERLLIRPRVINSVRWMGNPNQRNWRLLLFAS